MRIRDYSGEWAGAVLGLALPAPPRSCTEGTWHPWSSIAINTPEHRPNRAGELTDWRATLKRHDEFNLPFLLSIQRVARLGRNVGQPEHVLANPITGCKAERRPGSGE